ncbi:MAG: PIG-L family deacetylase, partial [Chitinophagaceae bacterium]
MFWVLILVCSQLLIRKSFAQSNAAANSAEIMMGLQKLKVLGSVLYIAAHPDDENTRLLTWLSKDRMYRTGYLSLTRGDGGQNLIGEEQGVALGLLRTQELLAARRIDGAEQFFTRAYDFGFSKKTEEALSIWDRNKVLSDVVWVIRNFKPDVIITRFPEDSRAGHGHHSGSAVLAHEAFEAAGDPNRFPEQFAFGVEPWKPKRIVWNTFSFGSMNTTSPDQYKVDVGGFNPYYGKSYGEIAAESRSQHKSQGFGVPSSRGTALEYFLHISGDPVKTDLMDGVDISWGRVADAGILVRKIDEIIANFNFAKPDASVKALVDLYVSMSKLEGGYWKKRKMQELQNIILQCSGLFMEAVTNQSYAVQGDSLKLNVNMINRSSVNIVLKKIQLESIDSVIQIALTGNKNFSYPLSLKVSRNKVLSQPYWLQEKMNKGYFNVNEQLLIGKPENDPAFKVVFQLEIEGASFVVERSVTNKFTDPVKGELIQPLSVVPAFSVNLSPGVLVFKESQNKVIHASAKITSFADLTTRYFNVFLPHNNAFDNKQLGPLKLKQNAIYTIDIPLSRKVKDINGETLQTSGGEDGKDIIPASVEIGTGMDKDTDTGTDIYVNNKDMATISYDHIPVIRYF